jgi:hypothetical protein
MTRHVISEARRYLRATALPTFILILAAAASCAVAPASDGQQEAFLALRAVALGARVAPASHRGCRATAARGPARV